MHSVMDTDREVAAAADSMYVPELHSHTEHTPLLPGPGGLSSEGTQQLRMMPRQLASEDTYRRDYLVFVQNIPSALHTPEDSPALTPCPSLQVEDDVRRKWANLQEETSTATRAAQDHFVTHNIPHSAAAYGQDTGMAGFLIGNSNTRNLLFLPSAASPAPQCGPALPSRVRSLHVISQNAASADEPTVFYALIHYARPLVGWVILCAVVLSFALMAPISQAVAIPEHERLVSAVLVAGWRCGIVAAVLLPCSLCFLLFHGLEPQQRMFLRTAESWRCVAQCGALLGLAGSGYNAALAFTSIPQAVMFVNVHPLLIIAWRLLRAKMVSLGEIGGVLLGALGMALVVDSTTEGPASAHQSYAPMLQGDLLALLTSVAVTLLLPLSKRLQARTPPLLLLTAMMALASGLTLGFAWLCLGATLTPDPWRGLGGLAAPAWAVSVWGGALLMLVGWAGCVVVTRYVNPVVVSSFMALEPCCAVALGLLLRVAPAPGPATAAGGLLMVAATVLVSLSSRDEDDGQLVPLVLDDVHGRAAGEREVVAAAAEALCNPRFVEQR